MYILIVTTTIITTVENLSFLAVQYGLHLSAVQHRVSEKLNPLLVYHIFALTTRIARKFRDVHRRCCLLRIWSKYQVTENYRFREAPPVDSKKIDR